MECHSMRKVKKQIAKKRKIFILYKIYFKKKKKMFHLF